MNHPNRSRSPRYAREGYKFFRVSTPSIFLEFELPVDDDQMTAAHRRQLKRLENAALGHGTHIESSPYQCG